MGKRKKIELTERTYQRIVEAAKQRGCDPSKVIEEMLDVAEMEERRRN